MKGEVEVTFKCEGCGTTLLVSKHNPPNEQTIHTNLIDVMRPGDLRCPKCSKLSYGPLTEEMVADALWECIKKRSNLELKYQHPGLEAHTKRQARFVLRLLDHVEANPDYHVPFPGRTRDWLLGLARQK